MRELCVIPVYHEQSNSLMQGWDLQQSSSVRLSYMFLDISLHQHAWFKWSARHQLCWSLITCHSFESGVLEQEIILNMQGQEAQMDQDWRTMLQNVWTLIKQWHPSYSILQVQCHALHLMQLVSYKQINKQNWNTNNTMCTETTNLKYFTKIRAISHLLLIVHTWTNSISRCYICHLQHFSWICTSVSSFLSPPPAGRISFCHLSQLHLITLHTIMAASFLSVTLQHLQIPRKLHPSLLWHSAWPSSDQ